MEDWSELNKLVIEDIWMVRFSENVTSFWFKDLPEKLHFSVSHRPGDLYWNLHLTKNVTDPTDKPKITICKISTQGLTTDFKNLCRYFMSQILEPFPIHRNRCKQASYLIKHEDLKNGKAFGRFRKGMKSTFQKCSKRVGKKEFRVHRNAEAEITAWASSRENQHRILSGLRRVPRRFSKNIESGILLTEKEVTGVIMVGGKLYRLKQGVAAQDVFLSLISQALLTQLHEKIRHAISHVLAASLYKQVERWDNPVEVFVVYAPAENKEVCV
ncbi:MAG: hypothetical protein B7Y11_12810 [Sphingobacteriia bacterium 24-36-13]|jgi:hypothetical protein|uniref:hypothetical protein n=1 Tax=Sediminibacterium sp. TaxID=1917865 RepID=UPI000BD6E59A|nr:hypothetical protein [Sediminibacterium sp.]OYZ52002.1 MAG: hypothetical protein B7Y11_12810 [Sphingobacteriia bacterium 24-36-13]OZA65028.1 MAG: hypothetical protein B7X68_05180 [Sphingobacteriia bacterium 39-36-14]HQS35841.1 hypothetical protein [Sediminibacterium sp.]